MLLGGFGDGEEFLLGRAVFGVALPDVGEFNVEEFDVGGAGDPFDFPRGEGGVVVVIGVYVGGAEVVDFTHDELAVLLAPAAITGEASCGRASPVHLVLLLLPFIVLRFFIRDLLGPVPG